VKQGKELNLEDFRDQLRQIVSLGGLESLLDKLPGVNPQALAAANVDPKQFRRQIGIIDSMTPRERRQPHIIDGSRKRRIAAGCGLPIHEVSRLLKQHKQLSKTMRQLSKGGGMQRLLGAAMRRGGPPFRGGR
jgi:signal recognition particle subunit SRP54